MNEEVMFLIRLEGYLIFSTIPVVLPPETFQLYAVSPPMRYLGAKYLPTTQLVLHSCDSILDDCMSRPRPEPYPSSMDE